MAPFIIGTPAEYEAAHGRISALLENSKGGIADCRAGCTDRGMRSLGGQGRSR